MTAKLPAPLVPAEVDLDGFDGMMIDIPRLRASKFDGLVDDTAWRAGVNLWFEAWSSVPAGSLEDDDGVLCKASGLGRDRATWERVKRDALRSWVRCADGRLYHPTVCETALTAWLERLAARRGAGGGNAARWGVDFDEAEVLAQIHSALEALDNLNPRSAVSRKYRKRYGYPKEGQFRSRGVRTDMRSDRKLEAEGRSKIKHTGLPSNSEPPIHTEPKSKQQAFEAWSKRLPAILAECPKIDSASPSIRNFAPLIALEAEGLDPDLDIVPAIIAVAKGWVGKSIFSWKLDAFAETAHGNHELRTTRRTTNGSNTARNGRGASSLADKLARHAARRGGGDNQGEVESDSRQSFDGGSSPAETS